MYDNFLQMKYGKEINFHIDFYKASNTKINIYGELQTVNGSKIVSLNLPFV